MPEEVTIDFKPYDTRTVDRFTKKGHMAIHFWGHNRQGENLLCRVDNFRPFFQMELPLQIMGMKGTYRWTTEQALALCAEIDEHFHAEKKNQYEGISRPNLACVKKIYFYREEGYPFVRVYFHTLTDMGNWVKYLERPIRTSRWGEMQLRVWEHKIPVIVKLLAMVDCLNGEKSPQMKTADWMSVLGREITGKHKISTAKHEYVIRWQTLKPLPEEEGAAIQIHPWILSFDLECYSDNHNAMPDALNYKHLTFMSSFIVQQIGLPETRRRIGLVLGDCNLIPEHKLQNCRVIKVFSEKKFWKKFCEIIVEEDPDVVTGYNILSFDFGYADDRMNVKLHEIWPCMGRLIGVNSEMVKTRWRSSAYSYNHINLLRMPGRLIIDALPVFRRDINLKLDSYSLDTVSRYILKRGKHDVKAKEMFQIYERFMRARLELTRLRAERIRQGLPEDSNFTTKRYERAKQEMTKVLEYCIRDSELVLDLIDEKKVYPSLIEMANVCSVQPEEVFTRGQQHRTEAQLYRQASLIGYILDRVEPTMSNYKGAFVVDPVPGLYKRLVCLDFKSLYPSLMIAYNMSYDTLIRPESELYATIPDSQVHKIDIDWDSDLPVEQHRVYKFLTKEVREGILPSILQKLLSERSRVRKKITKEKNFLNVLYDSQQNALKVAANSVYGYTGSSTGKMPCLEISAAVTAMGRKHVQEAAAFVKTEFDGDTIYGDTDSIMVDMHVERNEDCEKIGKKLQRAINGHKDVYEGATPDNPLGNGKLLEKGRKPLFPSPMEIEFEKAMIVLFMKKKMYCSLLIYGGKIKMEEIVDELGEKIGEQPELFKRGVMIARRDGCIYAREIYRDLVYMVLTECSWKDCFRHLVNSILNLLHGGVHTEKISSKGVHLDKLTFTRQIGANYKKENYFLNCFAQQLRKRGLIISPGDRLSYVVVDCLDAQGNPETKIGMKMRTPEEYLESQKTTNPLRIDLKYYVGKSLAKVNQLFQFGYPGLEQILSQYRFNTRYQVGSKRMPKVLWVDKLTQGLMEIHQSGRDIRQILPELERRGDRVIIDASYLPKTEKKPKKNKQSDTPEKWEQSRKEVEEVVARHKRQLNEGLPKILVKERSTGLHHQKLQRVVRTIC